MPRRRAAPRLYLDPRRKTWVIRDGASFVRTGCDEHDRRGAERKLVEYLGQKHEPERGPTPLIVDVLLAYAREHVPYISSARNTAYNLESLVAWWGDRRLSDVTAANCRAYAAERTPAAARRDLEVLRAAIGHWHRNYGPLPAVPAVVLPSKPVPRERWLTRAEAARLLWAARRTPHLVRAILLGLYTGSRPGVTLALTWSQVDLDRGILYRRPVGKAEDARKRTPPVKLGARILAHLRRWRRLDANALYVCHYHGGRVRKLRRSWAAAVERAGLTGVTPHALRRTRACWLMQAGVPTWEAAGHLGMSVEMLTRQYAKHHPNWQRRAAAV